MKNCCHVVVLAAALLLPACAVIQGDIDDSPRTQQVDDDIYLINFNAYDVAAAIETLDSTADLVCEDRPHELTEYRSEPLENTRSWHVVKATIMCSPREPVVVVEPAPEPEPEPEPKVYWSPDDSPIMQGQKALEARGYDAGKVDGIQGDKTTAAIISYQEENGLPQSGVFDTLTSGSLGTDAETGYMSVELVIQLQEALEANGFDVGRIDGIWGGKTETALREYQLAQGLEDTGILDLPTAKALSMVGE